MSLNTFEEFHRTLPIEDATKQAQRCMNCGVPFCQYGNTLGRMASGCPLHNLIPETNELVSKGNLKEAYRRLTKTHSFPEFTSRVCPALCEAACTCAYHTEAVSVKSNEGAIIDYAYDNGLVTEEAPAVRTGKRVAIVGSGPSGLAAAQLLNRRGHSVTVFERNDRVGGLLRYGIPNMKLDKRSIDRRVALMEEAGVKFVCNVNVGVDISADELRKDYDRVILCGGASKPRDVDVAGRDASGIYFAVDFLSEVSKKLMDLNYDEKKLLSAKDYSFGDLKGKNVIVIGGGDTGNDCIGTVLRFGASSVTQLEINAKPPIERLVSNPWPQWPRVLKTDYGQKEAINLLGNDPRLFQTTVSEFIKNDKGELVGVKVVNVDDKFKPVAGTEKEIKADLALIAAGFVGSEKYLTDSFGVELDNRNNIKSEAGKYETSVDNVFAAGDIHRGQSLVVWAIAEGRAVAKEVDLSLMGYTNL